MLPLLLAQTINLSTPQNFQQFTNHVSNFYCQQLQSGKVRNQGDLIDAALASQDPYIKTSVVLVPQWQQTNPFVYDLYIKNMAANIRVTCPVEWNRYIR